jgi:hypothetical protein
VTLTNQEEIVDMKFISICLAVATCCTITAVHAAEGFQVRYNLAGSLGGEMFAPPDQSGFAIGLAATHISIEKVTGGDGQDIRTTLPAGTVRLSAATTVAPGVTLPAGTAVATYDANEVTVKATGTFNLYNLGVGYVSTERFGGGRLGVVLNVPYGVKEQSFKGQTSVPSLTPLSPLTAVPTQLANNFATTYLNQVNASAAAETGEVEGIGDAEIQAGWLLNTDQWRVLAGASVVLPTGRYDAAAGPDIGFGNFYTFRPAVQVAWLPRADVSIAGKVTLGFNTRNQDNDLRSGNWLGLEAAAAYMTPVGPIGLHAIHVQQTQDDSGNPYGVARFRSSNVGVFFTTKVPSADVVVTLQTMKTFDSRYAKQGTFQQIRMIKQF